MSKSKTIALIAVIMLAFSMTAVGNAVAGPFTFKIHIDQDGNVTWVEPPDGAFLTCPGITKADSDWDKKNRENPIKNSYSITFEIWKGVGDPCVRVGGVLWCW